MPTSAVRHPSAFAVALFAFSLAASQAALADDAVLGFVTGGVRVQHPGGRAAEASDNTPVAPGDYVSTASDARAEMHLGESAVVRLGGGSEVRLARLDAGDRVVQLASGTIAVVVFGGSGRTEVDTPSIALRPRQPGRYRVTVTPDGKTLVTVRAGEADLVTPHRLESLTAGTTLVAEGAAASPRLTTTDAIAPDDFDAFGADRDGLAAAPPPAPMGPPQIIDGTNVVPPSAGGIETIAGTIVQVASLGRILIHDDRGFNDRVTLSPETTIDGGGVALVPGRRVVVTGSPSGSTFVATSIRMPRIPSYAHPDYTGGGYGGAYGPAAYYAPYPVYPVVVGYPYGYYRPAYSVGLYFRFR